MNRFARTTLAAHVYLGTAMSGAAHAGFTGSVTVDPFTTAVSVVRGEGQSTFLEFGFDGGIFDTARYALIHGDLGPSDPSYSSLSMLTDPVAGRLATQSSRLHDSMYVSHHHELKYRNADGSAVDFSGLVSFSYDMTVLGGLHGAMFTILVESATQGTSTAWHSSDYADYPRTLFAGDFEWASAAGWNDVVSVSFSWGWYGIDPNDVTRDIANLNANFIPAPGAMALIAASCTLGARRRRR